MTPPLTRFLEVDMDLDLSSQGKRLLEGSPSADELQTLDDGLSDALAAHFLRLSEEVFGQVCRDPPRARHSSMLQTVCIVVNT